MIDERVVFEFWTRIISVKKMFEMCLHIYIYMSFAIINDPFYGFVREAILYIYTLLNIVFYFHGVIIWYIFVTWFLSMSNINWFSGSFSFFHAPFHFSFFFWKIVNITRRFCKSLLLLSSYISLEVQIKIALTLQRLT